MKKYILIFSLFIFSCSEDITPIIQKSNQMTIIISSNDIITVTIFNDSFTKIVTHNSNQLQGTKVYLPIGDYNYSYDCGSGIVNTNQLYLPCP